MQSPAQTVAQYLAELPEEHRAAIEAVRQVILKNLDSDYEEVMSYGMIGYAVPHRVYPPGYHCDPQQPVPFAGLASQKNHMAVYLMCVYSSEEKWFRQQWAKTGKKLDMGKCCVRFKKLEDLPLELIGEAIHRVPAKRYIEIYESAIKNSRKKPAEKKVAATASSEAIKPTKKATKLKK